MGKSASAQKAPVRSKKKENGFVRTLKSYGKQYQLVLMFLPAAITLALFAYAPMYGLTIAFKDFALLKGISGSPWVGLENFRKLLTAPSFSEVFVNTIKISFLRLIFGFPAPILLALLLNEVGNARFKKVVQTISYLPHFLSWVVLAGIVIQILSPSSGIVNQIIVMFGGNPIYFVADPRYFVPMLIVTGIWKEVGWGTVVYLASITSISPELYEAATIGGAGRFQKMLHITLPALRPVVSIMFILNSGNLINAGFDQIYNLSNPAVYKVADIIDTYVYRRGLLDMKYSFSSAAGLFKNVISFALVLTTNGLVKVISGKENGIW